MPPYVYSRVSEFTATILTMWVVYGLLIFVGGFTTNWSPSYALSRLPTVLELVIGSFISVGGAFSLSGSLPRHRLESRRWQLEITGLILGGFGWTAVAIAAVVLSPLQPLAYVVAAFMAVAAGWRLWRVWQVATHTRDFARQ